MFGYTHESIIITTEFNEEKIGEKFSTFLEKFNVEHLFKLDKGEWYDILLSSSATCIEYGIKLIDDYVSAIENAFSITASNWHTNGFPALATIYGILINNSINYGFMNEETQTKFNSYLNNTDINTMIEIYNPSK
jgi:hypothetical protein